MNARKRVLFIAEAVTLAHVARPLAIAGALPPEAWSLTLACDSRYRTFLHGFRGAYRELASIDPKTFLEALQRGAPVYDVATLERYVADDLRVISDVKPDLIVGDFRLSLSVSARVAGVPYVALANAYWSPFYKPARWPVPQIPLTKLLPIFAAELVFRLARPVAFAIHSRPLNRVRRRHGLIDLGLDLCRAYTDADFVAYADLPELFPISQLPPTHQFIGPVLWEPSAFVPAWWEELPKERRILYVTLGSSGQASLLPAVIDALAGLDVSVVVATAGRTHLPNVPPNVYAADFLPGTQAAERASLVICNGGSLTCYQALSSGVPVIGIASNLDQFLNMQALERIGAGMTMRADRFDQESLRQAVQQMLSNARTAAAAKRVADRCAGHGFSGVVGKLLEGIMHPN